MTLSQNVADAVNELDGAHDQRFAPWRNQWQTIRAELLAMDARLSEKPKAYLHTLHMEFGQKIRKLTFTKKNAFGKPGEDYGPEYTVTVVPLISAMHNSARDG